MSSVWARLLLFGDVRRLDLKSDAGVVKEVPTSRRTAREYESGCGWGWGSGSRRCHAGGLTPRRRSVKPVPRTAARMG